MSNHLVNRVTAGITRRQLLVEWGYILLIVANITVVLVGWSIAHAHHTLNDQELASICLFLMSPSAAVNHLCLRPLQRERAQRSAQLTMFTNPQKEST
jgi:hypothetical protein